MTDKILGHSTQIVQVRERILRVALTDARVLVLGENGTGKELIAEAVHSNSSRKDKVFVAFNCAAVPESLMESELFGHEKGAFTGANERRCGRFEQADGGTLFLDEIGELPLSMQSKLLRVLQTGTFERIGGRQTLKVNARVIAATNRDLRQAVKDKTFREDLYHRIAVIPIQSPPLRERLVDIPTLVAFAISSSSRPNAKLTEDGAEALKRHMWPGNVRELLNVVERMLVLTDSDVLDESAVLQALSLDHEYQVTITAKPESISDLDRLTQQVLALTELIRQQQQQQQQQQQLQQQQQQLQQQQQQQSIASNDQALSSIQNVRSVYEALPQIRSRFKLGDHVKHHQGMTALVREIEDETVYVTLTNERGLPVCPLTHKIWNLAEIEEEPEVAQVSATYFE